MIVKIDQIDLYTFINRYILKRCPKMTFNARQQNAVIKACNLIVEALGREDQLSTPGIGLEAWLASDDTGASSLWMAHVLTGKPAQTDYAFPLDADDFGRCYRFVLAVPEVKPRLRELAETGPEWKKIIEAWEVMSCFIEVGDSNSLKGISDILQACKSK